MTALRVILLGWAVAFFVTGLYLAGVVAAILSVVIRRWEEPA